MDFGGSYPFSEFDPYLKCQLERARNLYPISTIEVDPSQDGSILVVVVTVSLMRELEPGDWHSKNPHSHDHVLQVVTYNYWSEHHFYYYLRTTLPYSVFLQSQVNTEVLLNKVTVLY